MKKGVIDIGNTRNKAGIFDSEGKLLAVENFMDIAAATSWLENAEISEIMISDVRAELHAISTAIPVKYLSYQSALPFKNLYSSPETLGTDRIAVMAAATKLFPLQASIVFDIGTCMTIDILHPDNTFKGGNISPGIQMRLKAMQQFTGRLPLADMSDNNYTMGNTTLKALANGVACGLLYEIEGYIERIMQQYPDVNILLCGGDAHYFEKQLKYKIFADQNLVLLGLYHLLVFND